MDAKDEFCLVNRKRKQKDLEDVNMSEQVTQGDASEPMDVLNSLHPAKAGSSSSRKSKKPRLDVKPFESFPSRLYSQILKFQGEMRKIPVPAHRYTPLKENWLKIFTPVVQQMKLQIRFNLRTRNVEIRVC